MKNLNKKNGIVKFNNKSNLLTDMEIALIRTTAQDVERMKWAIMKNRDLQKIQNIKNFELRLARISGSLFAIIMDQELDNELSSHIKLSWRFLSEGRNLRAKFPPSFCLTNAEIIFNSVNNKLNAVAHNDHIFAELGID
tara:strand:+ start:561 stop:977 length:417 start_codon:yes stop_codon:yes gene_type:complete